MDFNTTAKIQLAKDAEQIRLCCKIMHQLRPHLVFGQMFISQVMRQIQEGYHLAYIEDGGQVKAIAGFRFLEFLAWGKVLYIDDLVSDAATRKKGYGSEILKWVIDEARKAGYDQVHLDSGPQRHDAHRLYLNNGFKIIGHHFALDLKESM
jgi:GNAT superfamily N-acetyltransferase